MWVRAGPGLEVGLVGLGVVVSRVVMIVLGGRCRREVEGGDPREEGWGPEELRMGLGRGGFGLLVVVVSVRSEPERGGEEDGANNDVEEDKEGSWG